MSGKNEEKKIPVISVKNLSKEFKKKEQKNFFTLKSYLLKRKDMAHEDSRAKERFTALKDITFSINKGETFGIIGRNGSGKSTLLKLIAGIMKPTTGEVQTTGRMATLIELGAGFHPEFTGKENLFINANILGIPISKIKRMYKDIVEFSGIGEFINNPVKTYSSGMYMRLAFAVAVHVDPDILLIDEILAVGDEMFQHKCKSVINDFRRRGKTIVLVAHDMASIKRMCSRVAYLENGKLFCVGNSDEVIQKYMRNVQDLEERELEKIDSTTGNTDINNGSVLGRGKRWGRREVEITGARFLNTAGKEKHVISTGEAVKISVDYKVNKKQKSVIFGIAIHRDDGTLCFGSNTKVDGYELKDIGSEGSIFMEIDSLSLLPGNYFFDVAVHPEEGPDYDYHSHLYSFAMSSEIKDAGIFRPEHRWKIFPGTVKH